MFVRSILFCLLLLAACRPAAVESPSKAIMVNDTCSLTQAIENANLPEGGDVSGGACVAGTSGTDTITLTQDITLQGNTLYNTFGQNGFPSITSEIIINGDGHTIQRQPDWACTQESSDPTFRFFFINRSGNLTLNNLTLKNGCVLLDTGEDGGAIVNFGVLNAHHVHFDANAAGDDGGAVMNYGQMISSDSQFTNNQAGFQVGTNSGGAIRNTSDAHLTVLRTTFDNNEATGFGGAIYNGVRATGDIQDSHFRANHATAGMALANNQGTLTISDSIIETSLLDRATFNLNGSFERINTTIQKTPE